MTIYGKNFKRLRTIVLARNKGKCVICSRAQATQAHHVMEFYPEDKCLTENDLIGLCEHCHANITEMRKWLWRFNASSEIVRICDNEFRSSPQYRQRMMELVRKSGLQKPVLKTNMIDNERRLLSSRDHGKNEKGMIKEHSRRTISKRTFGAVDTDKSL